METGESASKVAETEDCRTLDAVWDLAAGESALLGGGARPITRITRVGVPRRSRSSMRGTERDLDLRRALRLVSFDDRDQPSHPTVDFGTCLGDALGRSVVQRKARNGSYRVDFRRGPATSPC